MISSLYLSNFVKQGGRVFILHSSVNSVKNEDPTPLGSETRGHCGPPVAEGRMATKALLLVETAYTFKSALLREDYICITIWSPARDFERSVH